MRIFVAGGTGVVGRRVVPQLVEHGHQVTVLARSADNAEQIRNAGARPAHADLFDAGSLLRTAAGSEVVINLATSIPPFSKAARSTAWATNDRIRSQGSKNLVNAAIAADASRYIQESVAFLYADGGSSWIGEGHPVQPTSITASALEAEAHARQVQEHGGAAVILRFGSFYGPDSGHTIAALRMARLGLGTTPGPRHAYLSWVATDDAADAVVAATAAPPGTYNVADDEPVTREHFDRVLAVAVGRRRLRSMPNLAVRLMGDKLDHVSRSQRVSNRALRTATSWAPRYPSVREGMVATAVGVSEDRHSA